MYLDANGDGLNTSADILNAQGATVLTVYLDTDHDKNGSLQSCNSHTAATCGASTTASALDMFSYTVVLSAAGGTVTWGTFAPDTAAYTSTQAQLQNANDVEVSFARPAGTLTPAGLSSLGKISVTIVSGSPTIQIARSTSVDPFGFGTGFGTSCEGFNYPHSYVLGDPGDPCGASSGLPGDWFDTDGIPGGAGGGNSAPRLAAPPDVSSQDGGVLELSATASDPDAGDLINVTVNGLPSGFSSSPTSGASPLTVHMSGRLPLGESASGPLSVTWTATDGANSSSHATTTVSVAPTPVPSLGDNFGYVSGRVLLKFIPGSISADAPGGIGPPSQFTFSDSTAQEAANRAGIAKMARLLPWFNHSSLNARSISGESVALPNDMTDVYTAQLTDTAVTAAVAVLRSNPSIAFAEPDYIAHSNGGARTDSTGLSASPGALQQMLAPSFIPSDPLFPRQWWLRNFGQLAGIPGADINVRDHWPGGGSAPGDQIGLLDTGIDFTHPDFFQIGPGVNFVSAGSPIDDDPLSHGTADAGIAAAEGANGIGVAGVNWFQAPVPVKIASSSGVSSASLISQGIDWSRQNGIPIIALNAHLLSRSDALAQTLKNAHAAGVLTAVGSGTEDSNILTWPAAYTSFTEGVAAFTQSNTRWSDASDPLCPGASGLGSDWGAQVAIAGPGSDIVTTKVGGYYSGVGCGDFYVGGTAAAAAAVAGVAGLVRASAPSLSGEDIAEVLNRTATDIGTPGRDDLFGNGRVNADAAFSLVAGSVSSVVERGTTSNTHSIGIVGTPTITFHNVPGITVSNPLETQMYEVRADITFSHPFVSPTVWGRKANSFGWRAYSDGSTRFEYEEPVGWAEVVPGSVTPNGCTLRTFTYKVYNLGAPIPGWFPLDPNQPTTLAYTAVGLANPTGVAGSEVPLVLRIKALPNPVQANGEFEFSLPHASKVLLQVFRVDGSLAREVTRGEYAAGVHRATWATAGKSGKPLPSGVYLYRLKTQQGEVKGKVMVLR
jgi:hypothetical protein